MFLSSLKQIVVPLVKVPHAPFRDFENKVYVSCRSDEGLLYGLPDSSAAEYRSCKEISKKSVWEESPY